MIETQKQREFRLAAFARDAVAAKSEYQLAFEHTVARTAKLRAERLAREASKAPASPKKAARR